MGRIVHYRLAGMDVEQINKRRAGARNLNAAGVTLASQELGAQIHHGNDARTGDVYPMVIVRTWGNTVESCVNGQVLLDGNDTLWVTSRSQGSGEAQWSAPERV
ncbi:MAG TPA: hypothetical protein VHX38_18720 [Pseudonocardiaceae bacterium]|nr:hypothetical protein [Pseudonocardiaceae bacterium]